MTGKIKYRADIDGLRAIAVLAVLFHHLRLKAPGGFVGVDVFFVISGYLISATTLREIHAGEFSLVRFYERRVRRIVPALTCVLAFTTVLAWHYLPPSELAEYAKSLVAAVLSYSNIFFAHQAGYFAEGASTQPLLHTWSLGVEEQFYLAFPLLLIAVWKCGKKWMGLALWGGCLVSFVAACVWLRSDAVAAFYESPLRAWELLLGALVSQRYLPLPKSTIGREASALAGLMMVLAAIAFYTPEIQFPGPTALLPCLGAVLLLAAGDGEKQTVIGRILSWRPLVFLGLISYSLYLWHWPIWVFQRREFLLLKVTGSNSREEKVLVLAVSLVLATMSWWLVERPFRSGRVRPGRGKLFAMAGAAAGALVALGITAVVSRGWESRLTPEELSLARVVDYTPSREIREGSCFLTQYDRRSQYDEGQCLADEGKPKILLAGDSIAALMYPGLAKEFPELSIAQATASNCLFVVDPKLAGREGNGRTCAALTQFFFGGGLQRHHFQHVVLAVRWNANEMQAVEETVLWFRQHGIRLTLIGPPMEYDQPLGRVLLMNHLRGRPPSAGTHWLEEARTVDRQMRMLASEKWGVEYVSQFELFCGPAAIHPDPASGCQALVAPGVPLISDLHHYSLQGSAEFARRLRQHGVLP